jgi:hypothetical protein
MLMNVRKVLAAIVCICTRVYPKVSGLAAWSEIANDTALCH